MAAEAAHVHSDWIEQMPDDYPPRISELVPEGAALWARDYLAAEAGHGPGRERPFTACLQRDPH